MKALVTGATGFIGSHLVELLLAEGWDLVCPVRDLGRLRHLAGMPVRVISVPELREELRGQGGFDYVFHVGAATRAPNFEAYRAANVEFTESLLQHLNSAKQTHSLKRFIMISSQAIAGPSARDGTPVTEDAPPAPISMYGRSKLEAEQVVARYRDLLPVTVIRPPTVFGPRDTDVLGVFKCARFRLAPRIAGPDRLVSMIYVKDLVAGMLTAALARAAEGQIYFMANAEPVVWKQFTLQVGRIMGCRSVSVPVPVSILRLVAMAGELIAKVSRETPLFRLEKFYEMKQLAWVCSPEKALRELGWRAGTPLEQAIEETATWYRDNGWV